MEGGTRRGELNLPPSHLAAIGARPNLRSRIGQRMQAHLIIEAKRAFLSVDGVRTEKPGNGRSAKRAQHDVDHLHPAVTEHGRV